MTENYYRTLYLHHYLDVLHVTIVTIMANSLEAFRGSGVNIFFLKVWLIRRLSLWHLYDFPNFFISCVFFKITTFNLVSSVHSEWTEWERTQFHRCENHHSVKIYRISDDNQLQLICSSTFVFLFHRSYQNFNFKSPLRYFR